MREIKFRGKRLDNGDWVEGYYGKGLVDFVDGKDIYKHFIMVWNIPIYSTDRGYFTDYEVDFATVEFIESEGKVTECRYCDGITFNYPYGKDETRHCTTFGAEWDPVTYEIDEEEFEIDEEEFEEDIEEFEEDEE